MNITTDMSIQTVDNTGWTELKLTEDMKKACTVQNSTQAAGVIYLYMTDQHAPPDGVKIGHALKSYDSLWLTNATRVFARSLNITGTLTLTFERDALNYV